MTRPDPAPVREHSPESFAALHGAPVKNWGSIFRVVTVDDVDWLWTQNRSGQWTYDGWHRWLTKKGGA